MEDPRRKKKDVWKIITEGLNIAGFKFSQNQVEGKWKSLIASHKALRDNKTKTGEKRKTFQYYERISDILSKRHDINPSFLSALMCVHLKSSSQIRSLALQTRK